MRSKALIVVLLLALIGAIGFGYLQHRELQQERAKVAAAKEATAVAKKVITSMTTYNYATVDKDFAWVDTAGTASFRKFFTEASAESKKLITELKATATGKVVDAAANVESADKVKVLLFVDQDIKSEQDAKGKLDQTRVAIWVVKEQGKWLVSKVLLRNRPTMASLPAQ